MSDFVLEISGVGATRRFSGTELPVSVGGRVDSDVVLKGAHGEFQLGMLDGAWFVQVPRTSELRLNGVALRGTQKLGDGDVIELDGAKLRFAGGGSSLRVAD